MNKIMRMKPVRELGVKEDPLFAAADEMLISETKKLFQDNGRDVTVYRTPVETGLALAVLGAVPLTETFNLHVDKTHAQPRYCVVGTQNAEDSLTLRRNVIELRDALTFCR